MAIKTAPIFKTVYLGELDPRVAELEGDCLQEERAWVKVRQATEADNMEISALTSKQKLTYTKSGATEQEQDFNPREIRAMEVFKCLVDIGNIFADDEGKVPLFKFESHGSYSKVAGGFQRFKEAYGSLPAVVTAAMLRAVYSVNPGWDWLTERNIKCEQCGHTWSPTSADWVDAGES